jgi:hypothetical protein
LKHHSLYTKDITKTVIVGAKSASWAFFSVILGRSSASQMPDAHNREEAGPICHH